MRTQRRSKLRRPDDHSPRTSSPRKTSNSQLGTREQSKIVITKGPSVRYPGPFARPPIDDLRMTYRFDGDSIAYFWAIETQTTLTSATIRHEWQFFAEILRPNSPWV